MFLFALILLKVKLSIRLINGEIFKERNDRQLREEILGVYLGFILIQSYIDEEYLSFTKERMNCKYSSFLFALVDPQEWFYKDFECSIIQ